MQAAHGRPLRIQMLACRLALRIGGGPPLPAHRTGTKMPATGLCNRKHGGLRYWSGVKRGFTPTTRLVTYVLNPP